MKAIRDIPFIETERLLLTLPAPDAAPRMLVHLEENRERLARWTPPAPANYYTKDFWREVFTRAREEFTRGQSMKLVLFPREDPSGPVQGVCNFSNIVRGPFHACYLGYHLDQRAEGRGLMREALTAAIEYAFESLKLHRIMANYLPVNERSGRLLRSLGFTVEGYARDYLLIEDRWQDHILTSLTNKNLHPKDVQ
ncbi:MAG: [ribosomal protein S5]-alanine N-acetyltransferase [Blastocatellia bacterium]|jgi:ribosomal-protein-alanine N-acetyltransferase|nr:[ribosomal protein S5]-alanine N-acetyltransferase [Blastocatellia bacterium]